MKRIVTLIALLAAWAILAAAQNPPSTTDKDRDRDNTVQQSQTTSPTASEDSTSASLKITNGPGADKITDSSAEIFWNTSAPAGSIVRYGASANQLTETAESSGGQTDHKVQLTNLQPKTKYFFQVESGQGKGTGTEAKSGVGTFTTH